MPTSRILNNPRIRDKEIRPISPIIKNRVQNPEIAEGFLKRINLDLDLLDEVIFEVPSKGILDEAKAKLESLGVDNLNQAENLSLFQNLTINRGGLMAAPKFQQRVKSSRDIQIHSGAVPSFLMMASVATWPQRESVLIADELDLNNKTITIMRESVSHLWIIARKIKARQGAVITYSPLENREAGVKGRDGTPNPADPTFNPNERQRTHGPRGQRGGNGNAGGPGREGFRGEDAPKLTILALEIDAMPDIILPGQQGGRGGQGGRGADGGNGQRGQDSRNVLIGAFGVGKYVCARNGGVGHGGHGGDGGNGGQGGPGGKGGNGSDVTIATQMNTHQNLIGSSYILSNGPGNGGQGGEQGIPGKGGKGGQPGHLVTGCTARPERVGNTGKNGIRTGDLGMGQPGSPGKINTAIITEEEWNRKLQQPWILSINPTETFAGERITVNGHHFVPDMEVVLMGQQINIDYNYDKQFTFVLPNQMYGKHQFHVENPFGEQSNTMEIAVRPYITELQRDGQMVESFASGDKVSLMGRSFDPDSSVLMNGEPAEANWVSNNQIEIDMPEVMGEDAGGTVTFVVQNSDGLKSNSFTAKRLPTLDSGFRPSINGYAFHNFSAGNPNLSTFRETFGSREIITSFVRYPVLTGAFYAFYRWFLRNNGHCTGMSATSLQRFHNGVPNLFSEGPNTVGANPSPQPPNISDELMHELDVTQGRVLSRELIIHYSNQGRAGVDRVEQTIREIETDFRNGLGERGARVLCFIPSGTTWDIISDPEIRRAFMKSHCVVPTRIVYPDAEQSLDGARLYVYENNRPEREDLWIDLMEVNGKLHFANSYSSTNLHYTSANGFTLGTATLKKQLFDDVSLPFSGVNAQVGLGSFVMELILSPARISIETDDGKVLGYKDGKMHSDPDLGYVCPWLENYILLRNDAKVKERAIVGNDTGTYTYMSIHPNGRSFTIKDADCTSTTRDKVLIDDAFQKMEVIVKESKSLNLHVGEELPDGTIRYVNLSCALNQDEGTTLEFQDTLDGIDLKTPARDLDIHLELKTFKNDILLEERMIDTNIPSANLLHLPRGIWHNLKQFNPEIK
ncbi:IPT/TIG domain-containing protein [Evansella cellulosilytica]|uniref:Cell surface receptor IPT/TIG domain protein n=1 Tax=Evansella cellulosilytica (strain ATCC 21833 / DSM 2522 / FERM P-1141 / JCM 9156 / N-4) TaxID=649639 RepID=E6TUW2_EVAC2|nr:IPT/TIG domain-containing protein [Evansella cellulosilytica]ADU32114.1 cell surface receptor IPT/TIG domain protein [Evansella cellulosilytica DSM 2522]